MRIDIPDILGRAFVVAITLDTDQIVRRTRREHLPLQPPVAALRPERK